MLTNIQVVGDDRRLLERGCMGSVALGVVVFLCGASTMILELVGSRILAPYAGTSIYVWTNLIGVILAFLSVGYHWGGKLADRDSSARTFSLVILVAAFWVGAVGLLGDVLLVFVQHFIRDVRLLAFLASLVLFGVPSAFLGMVLPFAVKIKTRSLESAGSTVGRLYALSTVGSIAGTFLAGFVLLSYFGCSFILLMIGATLVIASWVASKTSNKTHVIFLAAFLFLAGTSNLLADTLHGPGLVDANTPYSRVWVYNWPGVNRVKIFQINDEISSLRFNDSDDLAAPYAKYYRLCAHFNPDIKNGLMLGGAGYSYPQDFLTRLPGASMDVVEIDPGVTQLAERYFGLVKNSRLTIYHEDARSYLNRNEKIYDVIFSDVFKSSSTPFHVTTLEMARRLEHSLSPKGVFMANVISSVQGPEAAFLRAEVRTLRQVFPQVYVFCVQDPDKGSFVQNLIVVALKTKKIPKFYSSNSEWHNYLQHLWIDPIDEKEPVLTDDFAPVEKYSFAVMNFLESIKNPLYEYWNQRAAHFLGRATQPKPAH